MIKEGIIIGGFVFYIFVINSLVRDISNPSSYSGEENFTKSFLRVIDND